MRRRAPKPAWQQQIARERIEILFARAEKESAAGRQDLADRYVKIARDIGMKINVPLESRFKRRFCRKCHSFLVQGKNARVRLNTKQRTIAITCGVCGAVARLPFQKTHKNPKEL